MSDENSLSMQAQEEILRAQAAQADEQGVSIDELQNSIGENPGENADPDKDLNGNDTDDNNHNPSDEDGNNSQNVGESTPEHDAQSDSDKDTLNAPSSDKNSAQDNLRSQNADRQKSKAEKEEARREKSWKKLEEEKAKFLREKAEWEASKLAPAANSAPESQTGSIPENIADAFEKLAKDFEDSGDFDKADEAKAKAKQIRLAAQAQTPVNGLNNFEKVQFQTAWNANMERAIHEFPDMKDPNSDFGKSVTALLRSPDCAKYFAGRPDGVYVAAQLANLKMTALRVPSLEKENAALKEEINKLRRGMSLPDSGAQGRTGEHKSIESMSLSEQEAYFRKQAQIADSIDAPVI